MTRLTPRCMDLLHLLRSARWLTTSQIRRRFFRDATPDAVRKRLRKLTEAGFLYKVQPNRMSEALFTIGKAGKRAVENDGSDEVTIERRPPVQLEHFVGMNDIRIAAELAGALEYFFAYFELGSIGWKHAVIPDAVFQSHGVTFAVEFDRGMEGAAYFVRSKIPTYRSGIDGLSVATLLIVTESEARLAALSNALRVTATPFLYTTLDRIRTDGLLALIFRRDAAGPCLGLFDASLAELSCREESLRSGNSAESAELREPHGGY